MSTYEIDIKIDIYAHYRNFKIIVFNQMSWLKYDLFYFAYKLMYSFVIKFDFMNT